MNQYNYKLKLYRYQDVTVNAPDEESAKQTIVNQMNSQKQLFEFIDIQDAITSEYKQIIEAFETHSDSEPVKKKRKYTKRKKK